MVDQFSSHRKGLDSQRIRGYFIDRLERQTTS